MAKRKKAEPSESSAPAEWEAAGVQYRDMVVAVEERADAPDGDNRLAISISSEAPVERYDWWEDERFLEVLDHSEAAVDLSRASDGMPFLVGHDSRDMVGLVEDVKISNGRLRGLVRFSRSQRAQEVEQDMRDGIRKKISVGYSYDRAQTTREQKSPKELPTITLHRWTPMEASSVPIPADYSVGVGRSAELVAARSQHLSSKRSAPKAEEPHMAEDATAAPVTGAAVSAVQERDNRMQDLAELARANDLSDVFSKGVSEGKSVDDIRTAMIREQKVRLDAGRVALQNGGGAGVVQLTEKEEKEYSLSRAILAAAGDGDRNTFEMEVSQDIGKKLGRQSDKGFFFPTDIRHIRYGTRAGLYNAATVGAETVFDVPGSFIELLRKKARVLQAGATFLGGLNGPVTFPKQVAAGTAYWMSENPGTNVTESNLVLGTVALAPTTLQSTSSFSRQLLRQTSFDTENMVRSDMAALHALAIDLAALNGSGSAPTPLGIIPDTNCNTVALGTDGAAPTYTSIVQMEEEVELDDADIGSAAYITTPSVKRKFKTTQDFTSNGVAIWKGGVEGEMNGYRAYSTNQVPRNLTKGTSTTVCHAIVFGHWANLLIGEWGALEIIVDPLALKKQGMIEITSFQMVDVKKRYAQAFCVISDAKP